MFTFAVSNKKNDMKASVQAFISVMDNYVKINGLYGLLRNKNEYDEHYLIRGLNDKIYSDVSAIFSLFFENDFKDFYEIHYGCLEVYFNYDMIMSKTEDVDETKLAQYIKK